jgi:hypothetical protein
VATFVNGVYTVTGSGSDIGDPADAFHYVYQPHTGDVEIIAQVTSVADTDPLAKAGVMIRQSLAADAASLFVGVTASGSIVFQDRATPGGSTKTTTDPGTGGPAWVRLVRSGSSFTGYWSDDGFTWNQVGDPVSIDMPDAVFAGLAVTAHDNTVLNVSTFANVQVH